MSASRVVQLKAPQIPPNKKCHGFKRGYYGIKDTTIVNEQRALDLRLAGHNYYVIGKKMGVSHVTAWK
jgi:hypothetical protein